MKVKNITENLLAIGTALLKSGEVAEMYLEPEAAVLGVERGLIEIIDAPQFAYPDDNCVTPDRIRAMKKVRLVEECEARGIDTTDKKVAELRRILMEAIQNDSE